MKWKQQESAHPDDRRVSKRCEVAVMTRTRFSLQVQGMWSHYIGKCFPYSGKGLYTSNM